MRERAEESQQETLAAEYEGGGMHISQPAIACLATLKEMTGGTGEQGRRGGGGAKCRQAGKGEADEEVGKWCRNSACLPTAWAGGIAESACLRQVVHNRKPGAKAPCRTLTGVPKGGGAKPASAQPPPPPVLFSARLPTSRAVALHAWGTASPPGAKHGMWS